MKPLTDLQREELIHQYDPVKAHEYYMRIRQLKGRKHGSVKVTPKHVHNDNSARAKQRQELSAAIATLQDRLQKLEALIKRREQEEASSNKKRMAKKERAAKEHNKPKTVAEKAKINRHNKQYRDAHKQTLKNKAKQHRSKSGGGSSGHKVAATNTYSKPSLNQLKNLAVKVRGQIQVAKQKLAAL